MIYNMPLKDMVLTPKSRSHIRFEKYLITLKHNNEQLFLAAEQGSGKFKNDITAVINPRATSQSKR